MRKHEKTKTPTDADLKGDPLIGGGKGATASGPNPDELTQSTDGNTIEGDVGNDTNPPGGVDKRTTRGGKSPVHP